MTDRTLDASTPFTSWSEYESAKLSPSMKVDGQYQQAFLQKVKLTGDVNKLPRVHHVRHIDS
jgi:hypothetical protein